MSIEIYYFSGTGNSLHIAKELQVRLPEVKLIPIVSLLGKDIIQTHSGTVGFVFPLYLTMVPAPVRKFLKKLDLNLSGYFFSIATRGGSFSFADTFVEKILGKKGKSLDSFFDITMVTNTPTGIKPSAGDKNWIKLFTKENISKMESSVQKDLDVIQRVIANKEKYPGKRSSMRFFFGNLFHSLTDGISSQLKYYADSSCNGCGLCEKVCLSNKIKMAGKKPEWQKNIKCYYCFACFNCCPEESILLKNYTDKQGRYLYPGIAAGEIALQK